MCVSLLRGGVCLLAALLVGMAAGMAAAAEGEVADTGHGAVMPVDAQRNARVLWEGLEMDGRVFAGGENGLSAELREDFWGVQRGLVMEVLEEHGLAVEQGLLDWLDEDAGARAAVFGAIYPADARVLLNVNQLYTELGEELFFEHAQLCLAAAIARRDVGVGRVVERRGDSRIGFVFSKFRDVAGEQGGGQWMSERRKARNWRLIEGYLREHGLQRWDVVGPAGEEHVQALTEILDLTAGRGAARQVLDLVRFGMVQLGLRPERRGEFPSMAEYVRYVDGFLAMEREDLQLEPGQLWPMFDSRAVPWPMLLPMARTWPLDEAEYILEKYQGLHGGNRLHLYGPYTRGLREREVEASDWHYTSWPELIRTGGVCGTMSYIARGSLLSLGVPAQQAGQPGHSCVVRFLVDGDRYGLRIEQGIRGLDETWALWYLGDPGVREAKVGRYRLEYHYGLALMMNVGMERFMDLRMVKHLWLAAAGVHEGWRDEVGFGLMMGLLEQAPYDAQAWYLLAQQVGDFEQYLALMDGFLEAMGSDAVAEVFALRAGDVALDEVANRYAGTVNLERMSASFRDVVGAVVDELAYAQVADGVSVAQARRAMERFAAYPDAVRPMFETRLLALNQVVVGWEVFSGNRLGAMAGHLARMLELTQRRKLRGRAMWDFVHEFDETLELARADADLEEFRGQAKAMVERALQRQGLEEEVVAHLERLMVMLDKQWARFQRRRGR